MKMKEIVKVNLILIKSYLKAIAKKELNISTTISNRTNAIILLLLTLKKFLIFSIFAIIIYFFLLNSILINKATIKTIDTTIHLPL